MPVQIVAFQALQPLFLDPPEKIDELRSEMFVVKDPNLVALAQHPVFPERADYWPSGFFRSTGEKTVKELGSPNEYREFKAILAERLAGRPHAVIFEEPAPGPFFELLYFQEGAHYMIGPKTSEKLARDFADHRGQAEAIGGPFFDRYMRLMQSFELASKSGAVRFAGL